MYRQLNWIGVLHKRFLFRYTPGKYFYQTLFYRAITANAQAGGHLEILSTTVIEQLFVIARKNYIYVLNKEATQRDAPKRWLRKKGSVIYIDGIRPNKTRIYTL